MGFAVEVIAPINPIRRGAAVAVTRARPLVGPACLCDPPSGLRRTSKVIVERAASRFSRPRLSRLDRPPQFDLISVYRERNASVTAALVAEATGSTALWSLDEVAPGLVSSTIGHGRGTRFENLNRCLEALDRDHWLVVADDDVRISLGTLQNAVALAAAAGLDLSMPAHDVHSFVNWDVTRCRPATVVRLTRFVDQGPLLVLSPRARATLLPFPRQLGMGWGVEVLWAAASSLRIGILDAVRMRHLEPVAHGRYDTTEEWQRAQRLLEASPWDSWHDLQNVTDRWLSLKRQPPWHSPPSSSDDRA